MKLDTLLSIVMWRCPWLPTFTMPMWYSVWGVAVVVMLGNIAGKSMGWWGESDVPMFTTTVFVLLMFTPLETVIWMCRPTGTEEELFYITRRQARALLRDPGRKFEVHKVRIAKGKLVGSGIVSHRSQ